MVKSKKHEVLKKLSKGSRDSESIFRGDHINDCIGTLSLKGGQVVKTKMNDARQRNELNSDLKFAR